MGNRAWHTDKSHFNSHNMSKEHRDSYVSYPLNASVLSFLCGRFRFFVRTALMGLLACSFTTFQTGLAQSGVTTPVETKLVSSASRKLMPGEAESLGGSRSLNGNLSAASQEELLKDGRSLKSRGGREKVLANSDLLKEAEKAKRAVSIGVSRSESLADGAVSAPGIADFADFFRNSGREGAPAKRLGARGDEYLRKQADAEKLREQTAASISRIFNTNPPKEQRLSLYLRLAELQVERHSYMLELEIHSFNQAYDAWLKTMKGPEPEFSTERSRTLLLEGIAALRKAYKEFPSHQRTPEILFNLGFLLNQMQSDSAKLYFEQLVKKFPNSRYIPKAYLSLGEFYFQRNQFRKALEYYQSLLKHKGTDAYSYAVYKIGWSYFNLPGNSAAEYRRNLQKSLAAFQLIVKLSEAPGASVLIRGLRGEALKDLVLVFVDLKDIGAAERFYSGLAEKDLYFTFLQRLAWQATEDGEFDAAIAIYRRLFNESPTHKNMPELLAKVAEIHDKRSDPASILATIKFMSRTLAENGAWHQANREDEEVLRRKAEVMSKAMRYWSKHLHALAQKTQRKEHYEYALDTYLEHIDAFGEQAETYDSYFFVGEIYAHLKQYGKASQNYIAAVKLDERYQLGNRLTREAILNAIASLDIAIGAMQVPNLPEPGQATSPIPLPRLHSQLVWSLDAFERLFPKDKEAVALAHRAAKIQYVFGDYSSSLSRWMKMVEVNPRSTEAAEAIRLSLRVFVTDKDWLEARRVAGQFLAIKGVPEAYVARDVVTVMKVALFQLGLDREKEQKYGEAETYFLAYQNEYPEDEDAPKALYNAANNAYKDGRMDPALTHLKTLLTMHPKSGLVADALYLLGTSYDGLGLFAESADFYERLVRQFPRHKLASLAAYRSVRLRSALQEHDRVEALAKAYLSKWPDSENVADIWSWLGGAYEARSQFKLAIEHYERAGRSVAGKHRPWTVLFAAKAAEAADRAGLRSERSKNLTVASKSYEKLSAEEKGEVPAIDALRILARLRVDDVEGAFQDVMKMKITDGLRLTDEFTAIRMQVEKIAGRYVEIVQLGNAEAGIQSLFRVAQMQERLAFLLMNAPVPEGATPAEVEQFKGQLEQIAIPLQEESLSLYITALQRAHETEAMTPFAAEIYEKLSVLRPTDFAAMNGALPESSYYAVKMILNDKTRTVLN